MESQSKCLQGEAIVLGGCGVEGLHCAIMILSSEASVYEKVAAACGAIHGTPRVGQCQMFHYANRFLRLSPLYQDVRRQTMQQDHKGRHMGEEIKRVNVLPESVFSKGSTLRAKATTRPVNDSASVNCRHSQESRARQWAQR